MSHVNAVFIGLGAGMVSGALLMYYYTGWKLELSEWNRIAAADSLALAQAVREQADEMLADAEHARVRADALTTDTTAMPVLEERQPSLWSRVRAGMRGTDPTPDWTRAELAAINQAPEPEYAAPLPVPAAPVRRRLRPDRDRSGWPNRSIRRCPSPVQVAARLAKIDDPTRAYRVEVVR